MEFLNRFRGQRLYLDTNIFIYALEGFPEYQAGLAGLFAACERGESFAVTSELTLAEVLVKPFADRSTERQSTYERALSPGGAIEMLPVSRHILIAAARLRAVTPCRLPDAIHLATAVQAGCSFFLSGDTRLKPPSGIQLVNPGELK